MLNAIKALVIALVFCLLVAPFGHFEKIDSGYCLESQNPKQDGSMICF